MPQRRVIVLLGCVAALALRPALAWGPEGHRTVGAIADSLLAGTHAAARVRSILGGETLETAALWADCVKGTSETPPYRFTVSPEYPECRPFESKRGRAAMVAYVTRNLKACHPGPDEESCHRQYHYADVAVERDAYDRAEHGTSDHDVVAALRACIAVLEGRPAPAPFSIRGRKEALRLLAHYVGDIHQPLHVGAVYLDHAGQLVDPDHGTFDPDSRTHGGNLLKNGAANLHHEWDVVPASLDVANFRAEGVQRARAVAATPGAVEDWPAAWASESIVRSHEAFAGVTYGPEVEPGTRFRHWSYALPPEYAQRRDALQAQQLVRAGARLAQLLEAIWP